MSLIDDLINSGKEKINTEIDRAKSTVKSGVDDFLNIGKGKDSGLPRDENSQRVNKASSVIKPEKTSSENILPSTGNYFSMINWAAVSGVVAIVSLVILLVRKK